MHEPGEEEPGIAFLFRDSIYKDRSPNYLKFLEESPEKFMHSSLNPDKGGRKSTRIFVNESIPE